MNGDTKMVDALREVLASRIVKLQKKLKQARAGKPDGVHDTRSELRRIRADLDTMGHTAFDARVTSRLCAHLHDVERVLSKARDTDVLIGDLRDYEKAHARAAQALAPIDEKLRRRRESGAAKAAAMIGRRARKRLVRALRDVMRGKHVVLHRPKNPAKATPELVRHFTHQEVWRRYETLRAYDAHLPADVETLHALRSACRELRFTLEAFTPALPALEPIASELRGLQNEMGELHDHQVAIDLLARWRRKRKIAKSSELDRYLAHRKSARDELQSRSEPRWLHVLGEDFRLRLARALEPHRVSAREMHGRKA